LNECKRKRGKGGGKRDRENARERLNEKARNEKVRNINIR
jgi:hypothetical protein